MFGVSLLSKNIISMEYKHYAIMWFDGSDDIKYSLLRNIAINVGYLDSKVEIIGVDEI